MRLVGAPYGLCETCHRPISVARLDARPVARDCIGCATIAR
jgi:DnaK suppressor protein